MDAVFRALGLEPGGQLVVRSLEPREWGQTVRLECVYRARDGDDMPLSLTFADCREMTWRVYAFAGSQSQVALVDARLGRGGHRSPAHLLTARFGLSLSYGELR